MSENLDKLIILWLWYIHHITPLSQGGMALSTKLTDLSESVMWHAAELSWLYEPALSLRESLFISCVAAVTLLNLLLAHIQHEYGSNATFVHLLSMVQTNLCNLHLRVDPYMTDSVCKNISKTYESTLLCTHTLSRYNWLLVKELDVWTVAVNFK